MAKIYYYVTWDEARESVWWVNPATGEAQKYEPETNTNAISAFKLKYPHAISMNTQQWDKRMRELAEMRERLAQWNQGSAKRVNTWGTSWQK